jgi:predicted flap endonuclease-1-like 5' DNA nuclease
MKHLMFLMIASFAVPAWAQADKPPAKEPAKQMAKAEPAKQAAGPKIPKPRRWNEDARHCLERGSNTDIIKCAEEFL